MCPADIYYKYQINSSNPSNEDVEEMKQGN